MGILNNKIKWTTVIYAPFPYQIELVSGETFWFYDEKGVDGLGFNGFIKKMVSVVRVLYVLVEIY